MSGQQNPLSTAVGLARVLHQLGEEAEALAVLRKARHNVPFEGRDLPSDEAAALAEGWELQAIDEFDRGSLEAALEDLAMAEQILDGRQEHTERRGRICAQIACWLPATTADLRSVKAEYLATALSLLTRKAGVRWSAEPCSN